MEPDQAPAAKRHALEFYLNNEASQTAIVCAVLIALTVVAVTSVGSYERQVNAAMQHGYEESTVKGCGGLVWVKADKKP